MSSTALSPTPTATSNGACATQAFSDFPTQDSGCAVGAREGLPSGYNDALKKCCKSAPVESWANNCALYCLAVGQSNADLIKCFQDNSVKAGDIFCRGNNTASATGKPSSTAGGDNGKPSGTAAGGQGGNNGGNNGNGGKNAAMPAVGVSKAGLGVVVMVFASALFGALL